MHHSEAIATLQAAIVDKPGVRALFLSGSYGTGLEDAYSDIDLVLVAQDGASDEMAALWQAAVGKLGEIVLWWDRNTAPVLINAITADWLRIDVVILKPDQLGHLRQDALKVLFDPDQLYDALPAVTDVSGPGPARARYQFEEFIRILGLLPLADGRGEYINGVLGVFHLRNLLVELMIAQNGVRHRGGALHLNRLITPAQQQVLTALPPPEPNRDRMIEGHMAYAAAYLPLAREMAVRWQVEWPEKFEAATWANLGRTLGLERPY